MDQSAVHGSDSGCQELAKVARQVSRAPIATRKKNIIIPVWPIGCHLLLVGWPPATWAGLYPAQLESQYDLRKLSMDLISWG